MSAEEENSAGGGGTPTLAALARASLKVGCLGFGGPAGQIALMHRIFVDEKKWVEEARYLHALNFCMLLPGPEAQQLATYVGWLLHGVRGGVIAGALFVLPGALVVFGLSWLYVTNAQTPLVGALLYGVKAAVLALVIEALVKVGRRALKTRLDLGIGIIAFAALFIFAAPFPLVILTAGLIGLWRSTPVAASGVQTIAQPRASGAFAAAFVWAIVWLAPLAAAFVFFGRGHVLTEIGVLFSQLAVVTFGGAYAVLAYLQQQAVEAQAWLAPAQMIDGLGLAETTPGPLILVNQFVGFIAGWQAQGGGFGLAAACAAMASWCTFAPSFLWIFAGAPYAERLRGNRFAAGALGGITAAVLGVIANLALWFGLHVVFARNLSSATLLGAQIAIPDMGTFDPFATAIAAGAAVALIRFKANVLVVIGACALAGLAVHLAVR